MRTFCECTVLRIDWPAGSTFGIKTANITCAFHGLYLWVRRVMHALEVCGLQCAYPCWPDRDRRN